MRSILAVILAFTSSFAEAASNVGRLGRPAGSSHHEVAPGGLDVERGLRLPTSGSLNGSADSAIQRNGPTGIGASEFVKDGIPFDIEPAGGADPAGIFRQIPEHPPETGAVATAPDKAGASTLMKFSEFMTQRRHREAIFARSGKSKQIAEDLGLAVELVEQLRAKPLQSLHDELEEFLDGHLKAAKNPRMLAVNLGIEPEQAQGLQIWIRQRQQDSSKNGADASAHGQTAADQGSSAQITPPIPEEWLSLPRPKWEMLSSGEILTFAPRLPSLKDFQERRRYIEYILSFPGTLAAISTRFKAMKLSHSPSESFFKDVYLDEAVELAKLWQTHFEAAAGIQAAMEIALGVTLDEFNAIWKKALRAHDPVLPPYLHWDRLPAYDKAMGIEGALALKLKPDLARAPDLITRAARDQLRTDERALSRIDPYLMPPLRDIRRAASRLKLVEMAYLAEALRRKEADFMPNVIAEAAQLISVTEPFFQGMAISHKLIVRNGRSLLMRIPPARSFRRLARKKMSAVANDRRQPQKAPLKVEEVSQNQEPIIPKEEKPPWLRDPHAPTPTYAQVKEWEMAKALALKKGVLLHAANLLEISTPRFHLRKRLQMHPDDDRQSVPPLSKTLHAYFQKVHDEANDDLRAAVEIMGIAGNHVNTLAGRYGIYFTYVKKEKK